MSEQNLFEIAVRDKWRFDGLKGGCWSVEDVYDLPLESKSGNSLNDLAKALNRIVKNAEEEDFVAPKNTKDSTEALKLALVKHIIAVKIEARDKAKQAAERKAQREFLKEVLEDKKKEDIKGKKAEEIQAMLDALN